jgi:hypothetical protein
LTYSNQDGTDGICSDPAVPFCIYNSYQGGRGKCDFCQRTYVLMLTGACEKATASSDPNGVLEWCDFAFQDSRGELGCHGCRLGYFMRSDYTCEMGEPIPFCETHGYGQFDFSKTIKCIQCEYGYYLTNGGLSCTKLPLGLDGCAVPDDTLSRCFYCDGYHGWLETDADFNGYKTCAFKGKNWGTTGPGAGLSLPGIVLTLVLLIVAPLAI